MNRLDLEFGRLYGCGGAAAQPLIHEGHTRCLVLQFLQPQAWPRAGGLWQSVQADLGLPAPAIAIDGEAGYQLWWSLQAPLSLADAEGFLATLCKRYLPELTPAQLQLWPQHKGGDWLHAQRVPAPGRVPDRWSAFVAPDLAPVFAEAPYLDIEPSADGQADLLAMLSSIAPQALAQARQALAPPGDPGRVVTLQPHAQPAAEPDARAFLRQVMNDESVDLALRIEAAKALLPYG